MGVLMRRLCARFYPADRSDHGGAMTTEISLSEFEPKFLTAVINNATAEADGVAYLLKLWNIGHQSESVDFKCREFAPEFYLALAVGLRFWAWESNQTCFHIEAGLPCGKDVLLCAIRLRCGNELQKIAERLNVASLRLLHDHFVWLPNNELAIDLGFRHQLNDEQLDAIADFLFNNLPALETHGDKN
jgi:hypothetical protein